MKRLRQLALTVVVWLLSGTPCYSSAVSAKDVVLILPIPSGTFVTQIVAYSSKGFITSYGVYKIYSKLQRKTYNYRKPSDFHCHTVEGKSPLAPLCVVPSTGEIKTTKSFEQTPGNNLEVTVYSTDNNNVTQKGEVFVSISCPHDFVQSVFEKRNLTNCYQPIYALPTEISSSNKALDFLSSPKMDLFSHLGIYLNLFPTDANIKDGILVTVASGSQSCLRTHRNKTFCMQAVKRFLYSNKTRSDVIIIPLNWKLEKRDPRFVTVSLSAFHPITSMVAPSFNSKHEETYSNLKKTNNWFDLIKKYNEYVSYTYDLTRINNLSLEKGMVKLVGISYKQQCKNPVCARSYKNLIDINKIRICPSLAYRLHLICTATSKLVITPLSSPFKLPGQVTFSCLFPEFIKPTQFTWMKDGRVISTASAMKEYGGLQREHPIHVRRITIKRAEQQGFYSCSINTSFGLEITSPQSLLLIKDISFMKFTFKSKMPNETRNQEYFITRINSSLNTNGIYAKRKFHSADNRSMEFSVTLYGMNSESRVKVCKKLPALRRSLDASVSINFVVKVKSFDCCESFPTDRLPATLVNSTVTAACPSDILAQPHVVNCVWNTTHGAQWLGTKHCPQDETLTLDQLAKKQITLQETLKVSQQLVAATSQARNKSKPMDVKLTVDIMETISKAKQPPDEKVVGNILEAASNAMDFTARAVAFSHYRYSTSTRLLKLLQNFVSNMEFDGSILKITQKNIALGVALIDTKSPSGMSITENINLTSGQRELNMKHVAIAGDKHSRKSEASVFLTPSIVSTASQTRNGSAQVRVTSFVYQNAKLFLSPRQVVILAKAGKSEPGKTHYKITRRGGDVIPQRFLNSKIISASFSNIKLRNLSSAEEVQLTFKPFNKSAKSLSCVFWDFDAADGKGDWSTEGCRSERQDNEYHECRCNHLTNFALLMSVDQSQADFPENQQRSLSIITYIGCGISLVSLSITFVTYLAFRKLRRKQPAQILIFLCLSLILMLVAFLSGATAKNKSTCNIFGIVIHYFLLTSFCWMAIEGINMYLCLVKVTRAGETKLMLKSNLFSWGVPAVIVGVTAGLTKINAYSRRAHHEWICIINGLPFYLACLMPILVIVMMNIIILFLVLKSLAQESRISKTQQMSKRTKARIAIACSVLMGTTWIFGFFAVHNLKFAFQVVFCVLNSLQGFFIFVFYCLRHSDVRQEWKKLFGCKLTSVPKSSFLGHRSSRLSSTGKRTDSKMADEHVALHHQNETKLKEPLVPVSKDEEMKINGKEVKASLPGDEAVVLLHHELRSSFKK